MLTPTQPTKLSRDGHLPDEAIVALYFDRSEEAIAACQVKYGKTCHTIAYNILHSDEDAEECVSDTWIRAWNAIPPEKPARLGAWLSTVTRRLALTRYEKRTAAKRYGGLETSLEELAECVSGRANVENEAEDRRVEELISAFLWEQPEERRAIFIRRYWYFEPIADISRRTGYSESKVKSLLSRMRQSLKEYLEKEGVEL